MIPLLTIVSIIVFLVITLPPGDYITTRAMELERQGHRNALQELEVLRKRYGLDKPMYVQYWLWISHFVVGDFGDSFAYNLPVAELIGQNMLLTIVISLATMAFTWAVAIPIGVYSATHQYSLGQFRRLGDTKLFAGPDPDGDLGVRVQVPGQWAVFARHGN
jgi:peptide/nickel transport system permease protein